LKTRLELNAAYFQQYVLADQRGPAFPALFCSLALSYSLLLFVGVVPLLTDIAVAVYRLACTPVVALWRLIAPATTPRGLAGSRLAGLGAEAALSSKVRRPASVDRGKKK
jgi:hypothetical protein